MVVQVWLGLEFLKKRNRNYQKECAVKKNPFYGKRHSDETKKRFSETRRGRPSPNKGKKMSSEFCRKNSESHMGISKGEKNDVGKTPNWRRKTCNKNCKLCSGHTIRFEWKFHKRLRFYSRCTEDIRDRSHKWMLPK